MTISVKLRRDPQNWKNGFSTPNGFTIIELMVVLAVVAILTSIALPSYRTQIEKRQVTSAAEQLGAFLSAVQMEAVKRSENIFVTYDRTAADNWCIGIVTGSAACDCTITNPATAGACLIDNQLRTVSNLNLTYPGVMNAMNGDGDFVFDPGRGLICNDPGCTAYDAVELELLSDEGSYALNVQLNATGRLKVCSDSSGKKVPGYEVCS